MMNDVQAELIRSWQDDARLLLYAHNAAAEKFRARSIAIGALSTVLSGIVGTSVFTALGKNPSENLQIVVGLISMIAAGLTALNTFLNLSERTSKHQLAGAGYAALRKELEQIVAIPPARDDDLNARLFQLREKWDKLRADAPAMSARTLARHRKELA